MFNRAFFPAMVGVTKEGLGAKNIVDGSVEAIFCTIVVGDGLSKLRLDGG